jgi:hypothetical protein
MKIKLFTCLLGAFCLATQLRADYVVSGSNGSGLSATADFHLTGGSNPALVITLTNTSTADVTSANQVLTGLFFDVSGNPAMNAVSANVNSNSSVLFPDNDNDCSVHPTSKCSGPNVSGEWAYASGLSGAPFGLKYGISSSSYGGLFSNGDIIGPTDLQKTNTPLSGVEYGLDSAGDNSTTGSAAVTGQYALIKNSVVITLDLPNDCNFQLSDIGDGVVFQYGSSLSHSDFEVLPEPSTYAGTIFLALLPLAWFRHKRRGNQSVKV